jgi:signal transduction histidine kinase
MANFVAREEKIAAAITRQISFTKDYEDLGVKSAVWQDVSALIRNAVTALQMQNIGVDIRCSGLEVFADPLLEKVFYNLIDNSLHYGGEKMTAIGINAEERGGDLQIIYEDDGAGISADDKKQLFTKGFGKHTGLGLFLSREILSITGITITESGEPGKGARFEIKVPNGAWRFSDKKIMV